MKKDKKAKQNREIKKKQREHYIHAVSLKGSVYTISALPRYWLVDTSRGSETDRKKR